MSSFRVKASLGVLLAVSLLVVAPVVARAQGTRTFGTPSVNHTVGAFAFVGVNGASNAAFGVAQTGRNRSCDAGCTVRSSVLLPAGASVTSIQLEACDTNPAGSVRAQLNRVGPLASSEVVLAEVETGIAATPGCVRIDGILTTPETIDNVNNHYYLRVPVSGGDDTTSFSAVRVVYNLQVSPAPAVATFNDVPTSHPFFRFIEALRAAGITGGCSASPPLYCPDDPLTRGQAAAFFGRGLGLQFDP
jgi:hypothetical protein